MAKQLNLTDLVSVRTLEKIQENFSIATGIACVIRDIKGNKITKISNPSLLWQTISKNPEVQEKNHSVLLSTFQKCLKTGQVEIVRRYLDAHAFVVPIYVEGRIVAFFIGGLTRYGNPNINSCVEEATKLNIDIDSYLEMYWALPLVTEEKLLACANLFKIIASTISGIAKEGSEAKEKVKDMAEMNQFLEEEVMKSAVELQETEARYRELFNTINDGVYVTDEVGIIQEINKTGANLLGYEPEELIGRNMKEVYVQPKDRDDFLKKLYKEGQTEHFHPYVQLKDGTKKYFETNSTVIRDPDGKIIGVQGIFRNIDHRIHTSIKKKHDTAKTTRKNTQNNKGSSRTTRRTGRKNRA